MKAALLLAFLGAAQAAHYSKEEYDSGAVHQRILDIKNVRRTREQITYDPNIGTGRVGCPRGCRRSKFEPMALME